MNFPIHQQAAFFYRGEMQSRDGYSSSLDYGEYEGGQEWDDDCGSDEVLRILRGMINPPFGAQLSIEDISIE